MGQAAVPSFLPRALSKAIPTHSPATALKSLTGSPSEKFVSPTNFTTPANLWSLQYTTRLPTSQEVILAHRRICRSPNSAMRFSMGRSLVRNKLTHAMISVQTAVCILTCMQVYARVRTPTRPT